MKKAVLVALALIMVMGIGMGSASAANSLQQGTFGFNVDVYNSSSDENFVIRGKYFLQKDLALLAGIGLALKGGDADGTDFGITGGIRKYLKTDDFAPFVGAGFFYSDTEDGDQSDLIIFGEFGAEYFLHKQFSVEGSIGVGYQSSENDATRYHETTFGTLRSAISVNFYF